MYTFNHSLIKGQRKNMKKLILSMIAISALASADVKTVLPYYGTINYDNSSNKSLKDSSKFGGFYTSIGNLGYLFELGYNYLDTKYKDPKISNLKQHDLTMMYSKYYPTYMIKSGFHYINNNEKTAFRDLGNGIVGILGVSRYTFKPKSKTTYGLDLYYSHYGSAHNDRTLAEIKTINIAQFTPYLTYGETISSSMSNVFTFKTNFIYSHSYKDTSYVSYEFSDTLIENKAYLTLSYLGGDFRSGVKDNGFSVYNTKDLYSRSYQAKLGYHFSKKLDASVTYTSNLYKEYDAKTLKLMPRGRNNMIFASMSYTF